LGVAVVQEQNDRSAAMPRFSPLPKRTTWSRANMARPDSVLLQGTYHVAVEYRTKLFCIDDLKLAMQTNCVYAK
jgi:hypothetical protein